MKSNYIYIVIFLILTCTPAFGEEIVPGIKIGYDHFGSVQVDYITEDGRLGSSHKGWDNPASNLFLSGVSMPSYIVSGLGYSINYGYKSFDNNRQKFLLDEGTSQGSNMVYEKSGDLGSGVKGQMIFIVPTLYYHFFRESSVSIVLGAGIGISHMYGKGDIYLTDKYFESEADISACQNYLDSNIEYSNIDNFCEKEEIDVNRFNPVMSPYFNLKIGNFGLEFGYVNTPMSQKNKNWWYGETFSYVNGAFYYQIDL